MTVYRSLVLAILLAAGLPAIADAQLSVNKIAPVWLAPSQTKNIVITGTGFVNPVTVTMGAGITVNTATVNSATQITANVTSSGAATGTRNVRVTLADTTFHQRDGLLAVSDAFTLKGSTGTHGFTADELKVFLGESGGSNTGLYYIHHFVGLAIQDAGTHPFTAAGTTPVQRQAFYTAMAAFLHKHALATALLLHADRGASAPAFNSTGVGASPGTRAQWVAAFNTEWTNIFNGVSAGVLWDVYQALLTLRNATTDVGPCPGPSAYCALDRAANLRVAQALGVHANTVVAALTFSTPYPDDITGGTGSVVRVIPQVSAVHGEYRMAQWAIYRGLFHAADLYTHVGTLIGLNQINPTAAAIVVDRPMLVYQAGWSVAAMFAHLPGFVPLPGSVDFPTADRPNMNPRFNVAIAGPIRLTNSAEGFGTLERLFEVLSETSAWSVSGVPALTARGALLTSAVKSWKHFEMGAWSGIAFNAELIPSSIGQAGDRQGEVLIDSGRYSFTKMEPPSMRPGTSMTVTITGTGFENGMTPIFNTSVGSSGTMGVTVDSFSVVSPTQIVARLTAAADATPGFRDIELATPPQIGTAATKAINVLSVGNELAIKGGFTAGEQTTLQNIYDASVDLATGMKLAIAVLGAPGVSQVQQSAIFHHGARVIEDVFKGVGHIIHSDITNTTPPLASDGSDGRNFGQPTDPGCPCGNQPRSVWMDNARDHIDRTRGTNLGGSNGGGVNHLASLSAALTAAIASGTDAGVDATLTTVRDTHVAAAISKMAAADMSLAFATPWPDDVVGASAPSVVHIGLQSFTTHGGHFHSLQRHARQLNYIFESDAFYAGTDANGTNGLLATATFSSYTATKEYLKEIWVQFPPGLDQWLTLAGKPIKVIAPPPGAVFANMNARMAAVAEMWDLQMNIETIAGFVGGTDAINNSFDRQMAAIAQMLLDVTITDLQNTNLGNIALKMSDSWRNGSTGLTNAMKWLFAAPRSPTTRALTALPSTAPTLVCCFVNGVAVVGASAETGQAMVPHVIVTTGTTGAGPTKPAITLQSGTLPTGIILTDNGNGTATLSGTPTTGTAVVTLRANNGTAPNDDESVTITVSGVGGQAPTITSRNEAIFTVGVASSFTVSVSPTPGVTITKTGDLPTGITFTDNGNGTATIAGTAATIQAETYALIIEADNGSPPVAGQNFTLRLQDPAKRSLGTKGII